MCGCSTTKARTSSPKASLAARTTSRPSNAVFNLQGLVGTTINEFKVGYNAARRASRGIAPHRGIHEHHHQPERFGGQHRHRRPGLVIRHRHPGRPGARQQRHQRPARPYQPFSLSFIDSLTESRGNHLLKFGGEARMIRMTTDRHGGTTYTYANLNAFLANTPPSMQYLGDLSEPSVFNNGATGQRHTCRTTTSASRRTSGVSPAFTLNYGLRYDYYTPMRERDDLLVKFNIDTGVIDPPTRRRCSRRARPTSSRGCRPPSRRTTRRCSARARHLRGPGPDRRPDSADRERPHQLDAVERRRYPIDPDLLRANFVNNPNKRAYQPRAYSNDYMMPERVYQYTASVQQELPATLSFTGGLCRQPRPQPLPPQHRQPTSRVVTNRTRPRHGDPRFDIVTARTPAASRCRAPTPRSTTRPAAATTTTTPCSSRWRAALPRA